MIPPAPQGRFVPFTTRLGRHAELARQLTTFGLIGVTNTFWDFFVYVMLTRGWLGFRLHFLLANVFAFFLSVVNSYVLNKRFTFRNAGRDHYRQFSKFLTVNVVSLGLYEVLLSFGVHRLHLFDLTTKLGAILIVMVWNFFANKHWTFRQQRSAEVAAGR